MAYRNELAESQQASRALAASVHAMANHMDATVAAALHVQAPGPGLPVPCHCAHLDQLDTRVVAIETLMAARPTMGPRGGDPWTAAAAARAIGMPTQAPPGNAWERRSPHGTARRVATATSGQRLFPEIDPKDLNRIFDHKIAQDPDFKFEGKRTARLG